MITKKELQEFKEMAKSIRGFRETKKEIYIDDNGEKRVSYNINGLICNEDFHKDYLKGLKNYGE